MRRNGRPCLKGRGLVYGVGIFDILKSSTDPTIIIPNRLWRDMLMRCYSKEYIKRNPTYNGCSVCKEWLIFSNFKEWFDKNYHTGYQLDKDILLKGNKQYSPDKCCFVPQEINHLIIKRNKKRGVYPIGVYKTVDGKYCACIRYNKLSRHIGLFDDPIDAFYAYKKVKEKRIKDIAIKYKKMNKISTIVFEALYNYEVNIKD